MEKEVSSVINLSMMLIVVSVVIGIVLFTVTIGLDFSNDTFESMAQLEAGLSTGQLNSLVNKGDVTMPMASIYSILRQEHSAVSAVHVGANVDKSELGFDILAGDKGWEYTVYNTISGTEKTYYVTFPEDALNNRLDGKVRVNVEKDKYGAFVIRINYNA